MDDSLVNANEEWPPMVSQLPRILSRRRTCKALTVAPCYPLFRVGGSAKGALIAGGGADEDGAGTHGAEA